MGAREKTAIPFRSPGGLVVSQYGYPRSFMAAQRATPGMARNSVTTTRSGSYAAISSTMRGMRVPPPCWMFQARSRTISTINFRAAVELPQLQIHDKLPDW